MTHRHGRRLFGDMLHGSQMAGAVLVCGLVATALAWKLSSDSEVRRTDEIFRHRVAEVTSAVKSRVKVYEQVLWGGVGLFQASKSVDRDEWKNYVEALGLQNHWPGIQGLGWSVPVPAAQKDAFVAKVRSEGMPDFDIRPAGVRTEYTADLFIEPLDFRNQRALGFDMWSDPARRRAMTRARDTGLASTSAVLTLISERKVDAQRGFLTFVPVYKNNGVSETLEQRRASFSGWIFAAFRGADLMTGVRGSNDPTLNFEIYDGVVAPENLLFDTDTKIAATDSHHAFSQVETLSLQGRIWTIYFHARVGLSGSEAYRLSTLVALMGLVIDALLFYLISTLLRSRRLAEDTVAERTSALVEQARNLRQTIDELNRSNTDLERFASVASHDLQEPLRSITSFCQLLELDHASQLNEEGREYLGYVLRSSDHMRHLIQDLLTFSRVRSSNVEFEPISTANLVGALLLELTSMLETSKVTVEVEDLPTVLAGPTLRHVFLNLIVNAITYRDSPEGLVRIWAEREGEFWKFCVADDGLGIESEFREQIFELFQRLHSREEYAGTGLGLAVSRRVVESFGGRMWMEPNEPRGSRFYFTLQVVQSLEGELND